jgi:hypothetical protein
MVLHPDIARWMVVAEHERVAELRRSHPRPVTRRHRRRHHDASTKEA